MVARRPFQRSALMRKGKLLGYDRSWCFERSRSIWRSRPRWLIMQARGLLLMQLVLFTADDVRESLKRVVDPELDVNIVDLGLIYAIDVAPNADVTITMTLTSMGCPLGPVIVEEISTALNGVYGVPAV